MMKFDDEDIKAIYFGLKAIEIQAEFLDYGHTCSVEITRNEITQICQKMGITVSELLEVK